MWSKSMDAKIMTLGWSLASLVVIVMQTFIITRLQARIKVLSGKQLIDSVEAMTKEISHG
jgi:hypothetical protein